MSRINEKVISRLDNAKKRIAEISHILADPASANNSNKLKELYKEHGELSPLVVLYDDWRDAQTKLKEAKLLADDSELKELAEEETKQANSLLTIAEEKLVILLQPTDPYDEKNCFLEIRAGAGGGESCLFASDLLRMYTRWAENKKLKLELISTSVGDAGGYREIIAKITGPSSHALFKHEAGAHRVQRVPETESQGRVHTSVCTVAIMPEVQFEDIGIDSSELRIDTYRSSGAGGQHVNTTDSAVRVTHLPTSIVAECQSNRSQHANREQAMSMLVARVNDHFRSKAEADIKDSRRKMVGSGERNEKIRTYNFPQGRVTDHRVALTIRRLKEVLDGNLNEFHNLLRQSERAEQMEAAEQQ